MVVHACVHVHGHESDFSVLGSPKIYGSPSPVQRSLDTLITSHPLPTWTVAHLWEWLVFCACFWPNNAECASLIKKPCWLAPKP